MLSHGFKGSRVGHDEDRPAGGKHDVLRAKPRGTIRLGIRRMLTRNCQIDRFCQLDQRCSVTVNQLVPLALDTVKAQPALEMLLD